MKRLTFVFLFFSGWMHAQTTEEIIKKHIEAIGGLSNWEKIKTLSIQEDLSKEGTVFHLHKQVVMGKAMRQDIRIEDRSMIANDKAYYILLRGQEGWKYLPDNPNYGVLPLEPQEIEEYRGQMDPEDPFLHAEEKNKKISMLNIEYIGDTEYYKFIIEYASGRQYYVFVNTKTLWIDRMVLSGGDIEDVRIFSDYQRRPEGIWVPMHIESSAGITTRKSFLINTKIPDTVFQPSSPNDRFFKH